MSTDFTFKSAVDKKLLWEESPLEINDMARFNKIHGRDISLSKDDTQATRKGGNSILFSNSVLSKGETFSVNVNEAGEVRGQ